MYSNFIQFTIPKIGQALVAAVLYLNFMQLPFVQIFAGKTPFLYLGIPILLVGLVSYVSRDPLGTGMVWAGVLTGVYVFCDLVSLVFWFIGGLPRQIWQAVYGGGLLAWAVTALWLFYGWRRAQKLCTTTYRLTTQKPLPGGRLRIVQISDLHAGSTMQAARAEELERRVAELSPDLLVLTGDIYDENTPREDFEAFNAVFARLTAPMGKYFVYGNHDLGHHWREACYDRADMERAFADGGVRVLEDVAVMAEQDGVPVRIVGRKDWLYTEHRRFSAAELMPGGPDGIYTLWLDHEPRELRDAAAAGADLALCGHTHGGQVWPVGLVSRLCGYNEVNYGKKRFGSCTAIVSGGTGTWSYQLRTEGRTEIVCVDVESRPDGHLGQKP